MEKPRLSYQKCSNTDGYVTIMAQFMPTFGKREIPEDDDAHTISFKERAEDIEELEIDEEFEESFLSDNIEFFFLLDRSYSMY